MEDINERVATLAAVLDAMQNEMRDCWTAIHKLTDNVDALRKQVTELVILNQQPRTADRCLVYSRVEKLEARVDALESQADRYKGGGQVILWLMGGGHLATIALIIYALYVIGQGIGGK